MAATSKIIRQARGRAPSSPSSGVAGWRVCEAEQASGHAPRDTNSFFREARGDGSRGSQARMVSACAKCASHTLPSHAELQASRLRPGVLSLTITSRRVAGMGPRSSLRKSDVSFASQSRSKSSNGRLSRLERRMPVARSRLRGSCARSTTSARSFSSSRAALLRVVRSSCCGSCHGRCCRAF